MLNSILVALALCTAGSTAHAQSILVNTNDGTSVVYDLAPSVPEAGGLPTCSDALDDTELALGEVTDEVAMLREHLAIALEALAALTQELNIAYEARDAITPRPQILYAEEGAEN